MKDFVKYSDIVTVFAASNGDRVDAISDIRHSTPSIQSRFHNGQF